MSKTRPEGEIGEVVALLARLPGLGPRSAQRIVLQLLRRRTELLEPLSQALARLLREAKLCRQCFMLTLTELCPVCRDEMRDKSVICVVEESGDVLALERAGAVSGLYHVLGGVLSPLDGVGPENLTCAELLARARQPQVKEVILATNATLDGQTTAHYLASGLAECGVKVSRLARGLPLGGEIDYMDSGTLADAVRRRNEVSD